MKAQVRYSQVPAPDQNSPFNNKGVQSFTPPLKNSAGETDWVLIMSVKKR